MTMHKGKVVSEGGPSRSKQYVIRASEGGKRDAGQRGVIPKMCGGKGVGQTCAEAAQGAGEKVCALMSLKQ